ncbi:sulfotransferase family protein [Rhodobium orientis]|uniref:Sulfotransferase family protein n=1 Tax=Rhodobium orientis TaxID=34017 RepID=A0A327JIW1_9HYPH|nr:sulfotransferase family protein [Rhodobium orientis]RAI25153.1 sulfotransferase family protein [Rhodobium orientis]
MRIAMWSGPRNISTAMMRSFENRPDTAVVDEPFYAAYLQMTGIDHPMTPEIIEAGETDWTKVVEFLLGPVPGSCPVFYQKQMTHHMIEGVGRDWLDDVVNVFLIRRPENVLASYSAKREEVTLRDIGFQEQADIFDEVADRLGKAPPVIDAADVLADPRAALTRLCEVVGIPFSENMLTWPAGRRASDGVWAPHWYGAVEKSTGFSPPSKAVAYEELSEDLKPICDDARPLYEKLARHRIMGETAKD